MARLKALYGGGSDDGDGDGGDVAVTPDNWTAVEVFLAQETRWRHKPNGEPAGLDLAQVESALRLLGVKRKKWRSLFWKLRTMELVALEEMAR